MRKRIAESRRLRDEKFVNSVNSKEYIAGENAHDSWSDLEDDGVPAPYVPYVAASYVPAPYVKSNAVPAPSVKSNAGKLNNKSLLYFALLLVILFILIIFGVFFFT